MPSKDKVNKQTGQWGDETRPFTVFFVNPETPEEVHTDTLMAVDCEDAFEIAAAQHGANRVLHIRGIGETGFTTAEQDGEANSEDCVNHYPCARFINGKFHRATFNDDPLLDSVLDQS